MADQQAATATPTTLILKRDINLVDLYALFEQLFNNGSTSANGASVFGKYFDNAQELTTFTVSYAQDAELADEKINPEVLESIIGQTVNKLLTTHRTTVATLSSAENDHIASLQVIVSELAKQREPTQPEQKEQIDVIYEILRAHVVPEKEKEEAEPPIQLFLNDLSAQVKDDPIAAWSNSHGLAFYLNQLVEIIEKSKEAPTFIEYSPLADQKISIEEIRRINNSFIDSFVEKYQNPALLIKDKRWQKIRLVIEEKIEQRQKEQLLNKTGIKFTTTFLDVTIGKSTAGSQTDRIVGETVLDLFDEIFKEYAKAQDEQVAAFMAQEQATTQEGGAEPTEEDESQPLPEGVKKFEDVYQDILGQAVDRLQKIYSTEFEKFFQTFSESYRQQAENKLIDSLGKLIDAAAVKIGLETKLKQSTISVNGVTVALFLDTENAVVVGPETQVYLQSLVTELSQTLQALFIPDVFFKTLLDEIFGAQKQTGQEISYQEVRKKISTNFDRLLKSQISGYQQLLTLLDQQGSNRSQLINQTLIDANVIIEKLVTESPIAIDALAEEKLRRELTKFPFNFYDQSTNKFIVNSNFDRWLIEQYAPAIIEKFINSSQVERLEAEILSVLDQSTRAAAGEPVSNVPVQEVVAKLEESNQQVATNINQYRLEAVRLQNAAVLQFLAVYGLQDQFTPEELSLLHPSASAALEDILLSLSPEELSNLKNTTVRLKVMRKLFARLRSNSEFLTQFQVLTEKAKVKSDQLSLNQAQIDQKIKEGIDQIPIPASQLAGVTLTQDNFVQNFHSSFSSLFPDPTERSKNISNFYNTIDAFIALDYSPNTLDFLDPGRFQLTFGFYLSQEYIDRLVPLIKTYWRFRREQIIAQREEKVANRNAAKQISPEDAPNRANEEMAAELLGNGQSKPTGKYDKFISPMLDARQLGPQNVLDAQLSTNEDFEEILDQVRRQSIAAIKLELIQALLEEVDALEQAELDEEYQIRVAYADGLKQEKFAAAQSVMGLPYSAAGAAAQVQNKSLSKGGRPGLGRLGKRFGLDKKYRSGTDFLSKATKKGASKLVETGVSRGLDALIPGAGVAVQTVYNLIPERWRKYILGAFIAGLVALIKYLWSVIGSIGGIIGGIVGFALSPILFPFVGPAGPLLGAFAGHYLEGKIVSTANDLWNKLTGSGGKPAGPESLQVGTQAKTTTIGGGGGFGKSAISRVGMVAGTGSGIVYFVTTSILSTNLQPLPTIDLTSGDYSQYVEITKLAYVDGEVAKEADNPTNVTYKITISPRPGYALRIKSAQDNIRVICNEDTNTVQPENVPASESYTAATAAIAGLAERVVEPGEIVEIPEYSFEFNDDYQDCSIRNNFLMTFDVLQDNLQPTPDINKNVGTSAVFCFGLCPVTAGGCWPTTGSISTKPYPTNPIFNTHTGTDAFDISANAGTPVYAISDGVASFFPIGQGIYGDGEFGPYGNHVFIESENGDYAWIFAHLSELSQLGQQVPISAGDMIGRVGSTGYSTGPHLHFELRQYSPTSVYPSYSRVGGGFWTACIENQPCYTNNTYDQIDDTPRPPLTVLEQMMPKPVEYNETVVSCYEGGQ